MKRCQQYLNTAVAIAVAALAAAGAPPAAAAGATPLAGTAWRPVFLSGLAGAADDPVHVRFGPGDKVSGFAGCNRFFGSFNQHGDDLVFSPFGSTRKACAPDVMERETWFLKLLKRTRRVEVSFGELRLMTIEGAVFLRLEAYE